MIYSKQRELVLQTLLANRVHPTADELYYILKPSHPELSLATVYRNLNQLAKHGMVLKIAVPTGADRFDGTITEHHHMICTTCGKVTDLPENYSPNINLDEASNGGNKITGYNIMFYGQCCDCNKVH